MGRMGIMPSEFYPMEQTDFTLMLKGWEQQQEREEMIARKQTEIIAEALIGSGKGIKFARDAWPIGKQKTTGITARHEQLMSEEVQRLSTTRRKPKKKK